MGTVADMKLPSAAEMRSLVQEAESAVAAGVDETRAWLDSPRGRRYRSIVARLLVLTAPVVLKHPVFRTPLGRLVQLAGGAALVTKVADAIRDWEPAPSTVRVTRRRHIPA